LQGLLVRFGENTIFKKDTLKLGNSSVIRKKQLLKELFAKENNSARKKGKFLSDSSLRGEREEIAITPDRPGHRRARRIFASSSYKRGRTKASAN